MSSVYLKKENRKKECFGNPSVHSLLIAMSPVPGRIHCTDKLENYYNKEHKRNQTTSDRTELRHE